MKPSPEELLARAKLYAAQSMKELSHHLPNELTFEDTGMSPEAALRAADSVHGIVEARIAAAFIDGMGAGIEEVTGRLKRGLGGK